VHQHGNKWNTILPEKTIDVLVAGEINPDLILTGDVKPEFGQVEKLVDSATLTIGSSSAIFACGAARLGLKVAFIGVCGDDVFGHFMLDEIQKRDVDVSNVIIHQDGQTGLSVILNRESDRAILTHSGLIPALGASDIPEGLLRQSRHIHVASYFLQTRLQPGLSALFRKARELGLTTSLDTNYDPTGKWTGFDELLSVINVFLPNEKEAISLSGEMNVNLAVSKLGSRVEALAIKLGAVGALGAQKSKIVQVPSIPVKVVDTVGAGDSFNAGFIYGYLHEWELKKTLQLACVCGALSTQKAGGTEGQPGFDEAMKYVS
jgi:sugar/nucleoside kinase (ribokinase family)